MMFITFICIFIIGFSLQLDEFYDNHPKYLVLISLATWLIHFFFILSLLAIALLFSLLKFFFKMLIFKYSNTEFFFSEINLKVLLCLRLIYASLSDQKHYQLLNLVHGLLLIAMVSTFSLA